MVLPGTIILDMDDTILDESSNVESAWAEAALLAGAAVPAERLLPLIHEYRTWYWADASRHRDGRADLRAASAAIVAEALRQLGIDDRALGRRVADRYRDLREAALKPFPGAVATLEALRAKGVRLGLITNGAAAAQRAKIERFNLAPYFHTILIEGEFGAGKPEHRVYLHLAEALGTAPADAWIVGDNYEWEVVAPAGLGFHTVWVDGRGQGPPKDAPVLPHRVIRGLPELLA